MSLSHYISLCVSALISLTACSSSGLANAPLSHGDFAPQVSLKGQDWRKYEEDVVTCQQEILRIYGNNYVANNAIIDMRHCLIKKGYVLLS